MMVGSAEGSSTFHSSWRLVAPNASPASMIGFGTEVMPRWVSRTAVGMTKMMVTMRPGAIAEAEQGQHRDQVDEGRQRLHQVEDRQQDAVDLRLVRGPDAERHADGHRGGGGGNDQHQRLDGLLPQALVEDEEQADEDADGQRPASAAATRRARRSARTRTTGGTSSSRSTSPSSRRLGRRRWRRRTQSKVVGQEVEERLAPVADRDLVRW